MVAVAVQANGLCGDLCQGLVDGVEPAITVAELGRHGDRSCELFEFLGGRVGHGADDDRRTV